MTSARYRTVILAVGGVLEYNATRFGFQALYVLGALLYGAAAVSLAGRETTRTKDRVILGTEGR